MSIPSSVLNNCLWFCGGSPVLLLLDCQSYSLQHQAMSDWFLVLSKDWLIFTHAFFCAWHILPDFFPFTLPLFFIYLYSFSPHIASLISCLCFSCCFSFTVIAEEKDSVLHVCFFGSWLVFTVNLKESRATCKDVTPLEKLPQSDWPKGTSVGNDMNLYGS